MLDLYYIIYFYRILDTLFVNCSIIRIRHTLIINKIVGVCI